MSNMRVTAGLVLLLLAAVIPTTGRQAAAPTPYRLSLPGSSWALDVDLSAFNVPATSDGLTDTKAASNFYQLSGIPTESYSEGGTKYQLLAFRLSKEKSGMSLKYIQIMFGPARARGSATDFRDLVLRNLPKQALIKNSGSKPSEYKGVPLLRFRANNEILMATPSTGLPIPLTIYGPSALVAYFVKGDTWITIALVTHELNEQGEKLLYTLLDSAKFVDTAAPSTSFDYYHLGRVLYLNKDYRKAAGALSMALNMEQQQRQLDKASWRGLVGNLAASYGASGQIARAKEILDYAVANDPDYPVFQLALARYYARLGDLDNTIAFLEKAFKKGVSGGMGLALPDPAWDPAFEQFRKNERFRKALKTLKK